MAHSPRPGCARGAAWLAAGEGPQGGGSHAAAGVRRLPRSRAVARGEHGRSRGTSTGPRAARGEHSSVSKPWRSVLDRQGDS
uniref:Uncharacterized protein n=1 Tax=Arundo donax TaxID=35708 RepID=A0A0A9B2B6_ARUDO